MSAGAWVYERGGTMIREDDRGEPAERGSEMTQRNDAHVGPGTVLLTREGRRVLAARVHHLRDETLPELLARRANADHDHQADDDYERAVSRLTHYCSLLARAQAVETTTDDPQVVELGEVITLRLGDGTLERHLLVHPMEAPLGGPRLSSGAPLGRALLGRRVGEEIEVGAPAGSYVCRIVSAERLGDEGDAADASRAPATDPVPT